MAGTIKYYNLTGGLNTVQGLGTINQSPKRTESPDMMNVEYYKLGGIQSMEGNQQFANVLPSSITLGYEYIYKNTKYMIVCTSDGTVYRYDKPTNEFVQIYKFDTPTERHSICTFNNGIVISNGEDDLVFYIYGRHQQLSGELTLTQNSAEITGVNTSFTTDISVGDYIEFADIEGKFKVVTITDDTHLTVDRNLEFEATTLYYSWSNGDETLYTLTTEDSTNINVYSIDSDNSISLEYTNGTIGGDILVIPIRETITQTGQGYKNWTYNSSYGSKSSDARLFQQFQLQPKTPNVEITSTWTFPVTMEFNNYTIRFFTLTNGNVTLRAYIDNTLITTTNLTGVYDYTKEISIPLKNIKGKVLKLTFSSTYSTTGYAAMAYEFLKLSAKQSYSYNYTQEVINDKTLNRDTDNDKELNTNITNVKWYLSDISELNAVYTTDDDNIRREIRGLALNSYQGRIFVGANDGTLYYSGVGLIHGWNLQKDDAGAIPSFYDDNSDFTALGLWDKYLVICKRERSYLLDGTNADQGQWILNPYSDYTCDSQQSWLVANNSFIVYSRNAGGIYPLLQRTIYNPNYQGVDMSVKIRDSFYNLNESKFPFIFPVYHPRKKYIMFYMPFIYGNGSNYCYIFDLQTKTWLLRVVPQ